MYFFYLVQTGDARLDSRLKPAEAFFIGVVDVTFIYLLNLMC